MHSTGPTSRRVLPPGEHGRRYPQDFFCIPSCDRNIRYLRYFFW